MPHDVAASGADCFAHTDLACALSDRYQHDVHHADTTDHQTYRRDDHHRDRQAGGDRTEIVEDTFRGLHSEIIVRSEGHLTPHAQKVAHLVLRFFHHARTSHRKNVNIVCVWLQLLRDCERHVDDVVLIVTAATDEKLFSFFQYADDAKLLCANLYNLTHRRGDLEKIVGDFGANNADCLIRIVFCFGEEAPLGDDLRACPLEFRQRALKRNLRRRLATARDHQLAAEEIVGDIKEGN